MNKLLTLTIGLMLFLQPSSFSQENNLMIAEMLLKVSETHPDTPSVKIVRLYQEPDTILPYSKTISTSTFMIATGYNVGADAVGIGGGHLIAMPCSNPGVLCPAIDSSRWYRLRVTDTNTVGMRKDRYVRFYVPGAPAMGDWHFWYVNGRFTLITNNKGVVTDTITRDWTSGNIFRVDQFNANGESIDSIGVWRQSSFSNFKVPSYIGLNTLFPVLRATVSRVENQKFYRWLSEDNSTLLRTRAFAVPLDTSLPEFISQLFQSETGVIIKNELMDAPEASWSEIEFRDPWFVDTTDQYGKRNRGAVEARFWSRPSPFSPDATTLYNGEAYKGVFLNQGYNAQLPNNPYYAIRTRDNISVGGSTARFLGWSASGASLVQEQGVSDTLRKAVVFQSPNAIVKARYKGRLLSSLAEATNSGNQRRLGEVTVAYSKVLCLIYESAGKIWLTISTNNGTNWTNELYLGDGKNPTLTTGSQYALMAWNTGNGSIVCRTATFDAYNLSQPALSTPVFVTSFNHKATADAKPCIVAPSHAQGSLISTLFYESHKSNAIDTTWLSAVRVLFEGGSGSIYGSFGMINSPKYASPNASMDIAAIQEESIFGNTIHLVHTNYGTGAPYPVYYATVNTSGTLTYTPVMQLTDNAFGTWQPKNLTITLDSLNNKHIGYDAQDYALNRRVLIYRSISANNQSVSPATRLYSSNTGYRKPSINFFNGTVSLVWQTDDGWTAFGSRQLNNPNWYSFGFQRGWSSANTTIRGAKRFVRTRTGSAPYLIASGTITVSGSPGGGGGSGDSQARTSTDHSGIGDELAQTATLGNNPSLEDVPFFPVERTTAVLSNQAESAALALTLADVGLNGISRTGLTYHDLGANLLPDTLALSASNVFSLLKSRRFTLADTVNQMTATVKVHSKALYDLTQNNPVQLSVELFNVATGNSLALSQTALVTASDTAKDFHFTMNLPNGLNGTDVELRVKVLGFAIQASHKASALNEIELVSGVGGTAIVNRVGGQATQSVGSVPTKFALHQNYPNPFNPVTVIRYELPEASAVKVQVFDVLGRVVATVVNERKEAGIYEAVFNASGLSSGTYFYRLQAGTFVETKKMMLVK